MAKEYQFLWKWDLKSSPDELWFMASDTNRFNKDTWQPPMQILGIENGVRHVRYRIPLIRMEWEEEPFEWIFPNSFGVLRRYSAGPLVEMRIDTKLEPLPGGGTQILYGTTIKPSHFLIGILVPFGIGVVAKRLFERAFRKYDRIAAQGEPLANTMTRHGLRPAGQARFKTLSESVISQGSDPKLVQRLEEFLDKADDLSLQHIRAYGLADRWNFDRRAVLEMCLRATRAGILDMSWDLLCPSCRGAAETATNLSTVHAASHCETCNIDFTANFDHNVEVVFHVNPSIRAVDTTLEFCVGSPQRQPHIVVNQSLLPREEVAFSTHLDAGRYTAKASGLSGSRSIAAMSDGEKSFELLASYDGWPYGEAHISLAPRLRLLNITQEPQAFKIERTIWSDQASTAADVTTLQVFRDLFATEVLRPGEDLSVGSVTLMFTDLLDSTRLYRQIGDPSAFGRVRDHFVILEAAVAAEGGTGCLAQDRHPPGLLHCCESKRPSGLFRVNREYRRALAGFLTRRRGDFLRVHPQRS